MPVGYNIWTLETNFLKQSSTLDLRLIVRHVPPHGVDWHLTAQNCEALKTISHTMVYLEPTVLPFPTPKKKQQRKKSNREMYTIQLSPKTTSKVSSISKTFEKINTPEEESKLELKERFAVWTWRWTLPGFGPDGCSPVSSISKGEPVESLILWLFLK